jgi:hypothetical protein
MLLRSPDVQRTCASRLCQSKPGATFALVLAVKTTIIFVLTGALLGIVAAAFIVPPAIAWYASPGGLPQGANVPSLVQIPEVIRYATTHLIRGEVIGAIIGAVTGLVLGVLLHTRTRRPAAPAGYMPPSAAPTTPTTQRPNTVA